MRYQKKPYRGYGSSSSKEKPSVSRSFEAKWDSGKKVCAKCGKGWEVKALLQYENNEIVHVTCPTTNKKITFRDAISGNGRVAQPSVVEGVEALLEEQKVFTPSIYQQTAFDWALQGSGHGVMRAVAGSGKTTTIVKIVDLLPRTLRVLFVAFNKKIVRALTDKVQKAGYKNVTVRTVNSAGFRVIRNYSGFRDMAENKVLDILTEMGWRIDRDTVKDPQVRMQNRIKRAAMKKLVEMVKCTLTDYNDPEAVIDLINRFHIEIDEQLEQEIIEALPSVMEANNANVEFVDFEDQCYLPVVHPAYKNLYELYDFILVDETQDLNKCNLEFIIRSLAPGGRILAVGDPRQSLYAFRGAHPKAMEDMVERLSATVLPLSICYRCPRSHIERVQPVVPEIEWMEGAKEGIIGFLQYKQMLEELREGDFVVCRTNAPLVKPAFAMIKKNRKAVILGKDIGKDLVNYIERFQTDDLGQLDILMQEHTAREIERYLNKNQEMSADLVKERYETIVQVMKEVPTVADLITQIQTLFTDNNIGIVFSSVHRIKGSEANRVFQLRPDLIPHPKAKTLEELEQEDNCFYVAGTRALEELYLVSGEED